MKEIDIPLTEDLRKKFEYFKDLYVQRDTMRGSKPRGIVLGTPGGEGREFRLTASQAEMERMWEEIKEK